MLEKVLDNTPKVNLDPRDAGLSLDRACSATDGYVADKLSIYIYIYNYIMILSMNCVYIVPLCMYLYIIYTM
jgi:hypothetical protein